MGHTATWKVLENLMIEVRKKGAIVPPNVLNDLRSAKLMIKISESEGSRGDAEQKVEEYLASVESSLISEAQKTFSSEAVDQWLRHIEEATAETGEEKIEENAFITGVPRDQKWVRVEPINNLSIERMGQIACALKLEIKPQKDGKLVVYGQQDNIKEFIKKMTQESAAKQ